MRSWPAAPSRSEQTPEAVIQALGFGVSPSGGRFLAPGAVTAEPKRRGNGTRLEEPKMPDLDEMSAATGRSRQPLAQAPAQAMQVILGRSEMSTK